ncbi:dienelactone hydrolase family protein [Nocardioides agariphilus]|uniref:Dienelactone hydrolase family protein n=1 Tax=Nocardioides agariphilus TaxID=433664 RepID=A0A930YPV8_9ACTN|nr:dienelactone hydrolase family protein [Nocardioides agariphilus]
MAEVLLFHHIQGLTEGVRAFADQLRAGGHTVHTPDLFDGQIFDSIESGFAYTRSLEEGAIDERVNAAVDDLPDDLVYAGISYGVPPALQLTVKRPGARGLLMLESAMPIAGEWAVGPFPDGVPLQIHGAEGDEYFGEDRPFADEAVALLGAERAELFVYPGEQHLFTDSSLPSYDAEAAALVTERTLAFLDRL